jgi:MoxR-like ATPase
MKPSIEDQLSGTCRILETVVAPQVAEPFARSILDGLIANLRMLTEAIPQVPGFLRHDNRETEQLLQSLRGSLSAEMADRLDALVAETEPDATDPAALDDRNRRLRDLLAGAVCLDGLTPDQHAAILAHMSDRASRMPMRYVPTAPSPPAKEKT